MIRDFFAKVAEVVINAFKKFAEAIRAIRIKILSFSQFYRLRTRRKRGGGPRAPEKPPKKQAADLREYRRNAFKQQQTTRYNHGEAYLRRKY